MKRHYFLIASLFSVLFILSACHDTADGGVAKFENGFIRGDYAYVPFERNLLTIDISNPLQPEVIDRIYMRFKVVEVVLDGDNLYVGRSADSSIDGQVKTDGGVFKYDISASIPEFKDQLTFPPFVRAIAADTNHLVVSGLEETWVTRSNENLGASQYDNHIGYSYNQLLWHEGFLLGGGGFCSFRTGHCQGWLDKIVISDRNEIFAERLYAGSIPIFTMEIIGDRLVTHGRNIMIAPLGELELFPTDQVEYAGGSYSGVSAGSDNHVFYFAENHEIFVRQFNEQGALPVLIGQESSAPVGTFFTHMTINEKHLYAVSSYGLHIIDIADPQNPFGAAFLPFSDNPGDNTDQAPIPQPSATPTG
ncbi:MAG: hypothetical protein AB8G95_22205 [Anaerolineae bacterium]